MVIESNQKTQLIMFPIVMGTLSIIYIYMNKFSWQFLMLLCIITLIEIIDLYVFTNKIEFIDSTLIITKRFLWIHKVKTIPLSSISRFTLIYSPRARGINISFNDHSNEQIHIFTRLKELKEFGNFIESYCPNIVYVRKLFKEEKIKKNEH